VRIRGTSLIIAVVIVGVAMAGATWLQDYRQFPWVIFFGVFFPVQWIVVMAAGGPHEVSGETYITVLTAVLAILMWYGLIEGGRVWRQHRTKRDHAAHSEI
jgi:hypothetical protein